MMVMGIDDSCLQTVSWHSCLVCPDSWKPHQVNRMNSWQLFCHDDSIISSCHECYYNRPTIRQVASWCCGRVSDLRSITSMGNLYLYLLLSDVIHLQQWGKDSQRVVADHESKPCYSSFPRVCVLTMLTYFIDVLSISLWMFYSVLSSVSVINKRTWIWVVTF